MHVLEIMNTEVSTVRAEATLPEVARKLVSHPHRLLYVVDEAGHLLGIISTVEVLKLLAPFYLDANLARSLPMGMSMAEEACREHLHDTASQIMQHSITTLAGDDHVQHAEALIRMKTINALPVVDETGVLVGEVSRTEILGLFSKALTAMEEEAR